MDTRFHELMYEASHSRIPPYTLGDFHQYVQKARKISITSRVRSRKSNEEHGMILEAIRAQNVAGGSLCHPVHFEHHKEFGKWFGCGAGENNDLKHKEENDNR